MTLEQARAKLAALPTQYQIGWDFAKEVCEKGELQRGEHVDIGGIINKEVERGFWEYANAWKFLHQFDERRPS